MKKKPVISKNFDMNISFEELMKYNKDCRVNINSDHHFESFNGVLIFVSHPNIKAPYTIELGVDEFGIVYEGDIGRSDEYPVIPIHDGFELLESYRQMLVSRSNIESVLLSNRLEYSDVVAKIIVK